MLTLQEIVRRLQDRRAAMVADACKLRVATVIDIREGRTKNPSYETVKALSDYLCEASVGVVEI